MLALSGNPVYPHTALCVTTSGCQYAKKALTTLDRPLDPSRPFSPSDRSPRPLDDTLKVPREELERIRRGVTEAPDRQRALALLLSETRRLTRAEAGTIYLRGGDHLGFAVVQNDVLARRFGEEVVQRGLAATPLPLTEPSIASYVALTRATVSIPEIYDIPPDRPYTFDQRTDATSGYRTRSMLALPLRDGRGAAFGVLQLINALDDSGAVVPFDADAERLVAALLAHVATSYPTA